jgi:hypothetical protein
MPIGGVGGVALNSVETCPRLKWNHQSTGDMEGVDYWTLASGNKS